MKISLRHANAIQEQIREVIRTINYEPLLELTEFEPDVDGAITAATTKYLAEIRRRDALVTALYAIRESVGIAKSSAGIDQLLTNAARIETLLSFSKVKDHSRVDSVEIAKLKLDRIRETPYDKRVYGFDGTVWVSVLSEEQLNDLRDTDAKLKREKATIQNKILELNIRTEIDLSADTIETLSRERLL